MPDRLKTITVGELIELLGGLPPAAMVVLSSDGEGNSFSPMRASYDAGRYVSAGPGGVVGTFIDLPEQLERVATAVVFYPLQ
jgi:hypothetical protein